MERFQEIKALVHEQLKGHYIQLFFISLLSTLLVNGLSSSLAIVLDYESTTYMILSFLCTILGLLVNNTVLFLFIKRVRNERFSGEDITLSMRMLVQQFVAAIAIGLIQFILQLAATFTVFFLPLYYVLTVLVSVLIKLWCVLIAYAIYDQDHRMMELVGGSLMLLRTNMKIVAKASLPYILWFLATQIALNMAVFNMISTEGIINSVFGILEAAYENGPTALFVIGSLYLLNFIVTIWLSIPLFQFMANVYHQDRHTYYPSAISLDQSNQNER